MKVTIIGSSQYIDMMLSYKRKLENQGHKVFIPAFDVNPELDELEICKCNRDLISMADEIHIIWDNRSVGTIFDFGMAFALKKKIKLVYIEKKTFENVMRLYEQECTMRMYEQEFI